MSSSLFSSIRSPIEIIPDDKDKSSSFSGIPLGIVLGVGALVALGGVLFYWREKSITELKNTCHGLAQENKNLRNRLRQLHHQNQDHKATQKASLKELRSSKKHNRELESRILALIEALSDQQPGTQIRLLEKQVYNELLETLRTENTLLRQKNEQLHNSLDCSICVAQVANCILRPCGHTMCMDCYSRIAGDWAATASVVLTPTPSSGLSSFIGGSSSVSVSSTSGLGVSTSSGGKRAQSGPLCPFCRSEIIEMLPKFHS